ncbi:MAG: hypothetical protein C0404_01975 [Verrucomicrobia bacterium]|nr:hypothetical protein [Verrucomicrobiota bacterium]
MLRKMHGIGLLVAVAVLTGGCALLEPFTGTTTSDSNAKFNLPEYKGVKHAVGCKDFDNQAGWHGSWHLGNNLSIMLESALYDTGRFVVVERKDLGEVLKEQDLVTSGRAAPAKQVAKTGLVRPARYLAGGSITVVEEGQSGGNAGISFGGVSLGGGKSKAQITIIAKLIDTTTSQVVKKQSITGKSGSVSLNVGLNFKGVSTELGGFAKTPLGEAAQDCINQAALFFAKEMEKLPVDACVVSAKDGKIIINRGAEYGIAAGQNYVMEELGEPQIDPNSGELLGNLPGKVLGKIVVKSVQEKFSVCESVSGDKSPKQGTLVRAE